MGYDVHITRAESWEESEGTPIPMEDWKRLVEEDPELHPLSALTRDVCGPVRAGSGQHTGTPVRHPM